MLMQRTEPIGEAGPVASVRRSLGGWRQQLLHFILKRRVFISALLFGSLVVEDVVTGVVPHDIFNFATRGRYRAFSR